MIFMISTPMFHIATTSHIQHLAIPIYIYNLVKGIVVNCWSWHYIYFYALLCL